MQNFRLEKILFSYYQKTEPKLSLILVIAKN